MNLGGLGVVVVFSCGLSDYTTVLLYFQFYEKCKTQNKIFYEIPILFLKLTIRY